MNKDEKLVNRVGPGGYKCHCCGPAPKDRPVWRRAMRKRLKVLHRKVIRQAEED
jgi:hypothetical protein